MSCPTTTLWVWTRTTREYYEYDVFMDGEKTTLLTRKDDLEVGLYQIKSYEDDLYAEFEKNVDGDLVKTEESVSTVDYEDGTLTLDDESYLLADDVKVYTIDGTTVQVHWRPAPSRTA